MSGFEEGDYENVRDAIATLAGGGMVNHYVVVADITPLQGDRAVHLVTDCDHAWQSLGLLRHATLCIEVDKYHDDEGDEA